MLGPMTDHAAPRFAVATFERVFDVEPNRDIVSLERLSTALQRFMVKPETRARVRRAERLIEAAWTSFEAGEHRSGKAWTRLSKAARQGEKSGEDPAAAARREREQMLSEARSDPKRDLRLWSPAHYPPDSRRGSENVLHLSCLVLDYDSGLPIDEAAAAWEAYFHIVHTTWSHTPETPKFRLVLPLAEPVRPEDWRTVYEWAEERAGGGGADRPVDPTGKSIGTTFALPAVADAAMPRVAFAQPGPLLDACLEGLIETAADLPDDAEPHAPNHFRIPIPGHDVVEGTHDASFAIAEPGPKRDREPAAGARSAAPAATDGPSPTADRSTTDPPGEDGDDPWNDIAFPWD